MKPQNRWFRAILVSGLLGGSFLMPLETVQAAPAQQEKAGKTVSVSINKADSEQLESVRGIGPALAERIIQYRQNNGPFEHLEDLVRVPGIGQAKFERIKAELAV